MNRSMNSLSTHNRVKTIKLAPYGTDGRLFCQLQTSKSRHTKTTPNIKNLARLNLDIVP